MEAKEYIVLLRGINVSVKNKIRMEDLRALCESLGYHQVRSYIQSGNLIRYYSFSWHINLLNLQR